MKQTVKIIGGKYRGKNISFLDAKDLRPTPNRVKETLFNWLMHDIQGARCLDAFAGSGALGFEALSRGAAEVTFIDASPATCALLKQNASALSGASGWAVHCMNTLTHLKQVKLPYQIIFLDPPFSSDLLSRSLTLLETTTCLTEKGLIYIESEHEVHVNSNYWFKRQHKKAGQVHYALYEKRLDKEASSCFNHPVPL